MELAELEEKEEEARELRSNYIDQLQKQVSLAKNTVMGEQLLRQQLQADFEYNLNLMKERDKELLKYEAVLTEMRLAINQLTAENSELKVTLADRENCIVKDKESHIERMATLQSEMQVWKCNMNSEVACERRKYEEMRKELEKRLREMECEVENVRLELTAHYEEDIHKIQRQHKIQVEQLEDVVMECQSQLKAKTREIDQITKQLLTTQNEEKCLRERESELERQMKAQEWAWQNRLVTMETELRQAHKEMEQKLTTFTSSHNHLINKCSELDRQVREKSLHLQEAKKCWSERETSLECQVRELENDINKMKMNERETNEAIQDQLKEKNLIIDSLQSDYERKLSQREKILSETTSQLLIANKEIKQLKTALNISTTQLQQCEEKVRVCRIRNDELESEYREKVRETERRANARTQSTIVNITQDRDQVASEVCNLKDQLSRQQKMLDEITKERDIAIATLNSDKRVNPSNEVLTQQNHQLRAVIETMRKEMEHVISGCGHSEGGCGHGGYISYLEKELVHVKNENRQLKADKKPPPTPPPHYSSQQINDVLRREKTAADKKIIFLQNTLTTTQTRLRHSMEQVYELKSVQTPPERCQEKLLLATRSIISLLRERDMLLADDRTRRELKSQPSPDVTQLTDDDDNIPSINNSLQFTESEIDGQRSLDKLVDDNTMTSSPVTLSPRSQPQSINKPDMITMEMHGQQVKPIPRKSHKKRR